MKSIITLILLATLISCTKEEKVMSYYENGQPEWIVKYNSSSDTTDKVVIGYFSDGIKKCIRNLKNGLENGEQIVFFPNGQINTSCYKINNVQTGLYKAYFETGKLYAQGNYFNGLRNGKWELWNKEGNKFIRHYLNDILHGQTKEIRVDGSIVFGQYNEGSEIGMWVTKSPDSVITMITNYGSGVLQGSVKQFYSTGQIYINGFFLNGKKHGEWEIYSKSGSVDTIEIYKDNRLVEYKKK